MRKLLTVQFIAFLTLVLFSMTAGLHASERTMVLFETNYGDITVELFDNDAPITVENFLKYVNDEFYDDIIFHRVIDDFMIQAGVYDIDVYDADFTVDDFDLQDPCYYHEPTYDYINFEDYSTGQGNTNVRGTIAMANYQLNSTTRVNTSQFFFNQSPSDNTNLDGDHTVFGEITSGMDIVDLIAGDEQTEDSDILQHSIFANLPLEPAYIETARVVRHFDPCAYDLSDVPYLHASDNAIRTFIWHDAGNPDYYRHVFSTTTFLGIDCLEWTVVPEDDDSMEQFTITIAQDDDGNNWLLKYALNQDTSEEVIVFEADNLLSAKLFEDYADESMIFRIMSQTFNNDDLDDPVNTVTTGTGADMVTEKIMGFNESVASLPDAYQNNLILVRRTVGPEDEITDTQWFYYHESIGLVLHLTNEAGDVTEERWSLNPFNFDDSSNDFSETPFLMVPTQTSTFTRKFFEQIHPDDYIAGTSHLKYYHTFTHPTSAFQGVKYMQWKQTITGVHGIDNFTIQLIKDINDVIWVKQYILNGETIIDIEEVLDVVPLSDLDEVVIFRLITGTYNADDIDDPLNSYTLNAGDALETYTITSFTDTVDRIPHYENELVKVNSWIGGDPGDLEPATAYYHSSVGLVMSLNAGETETVGNGWYLAYWGGQFDEESSFDFTDVPFVNATAGDERLFIAQGDRDPNEYNYRYEKYSRAGIQCLKWTQDAEDNEDIDDFYIYLAKDSLGEIWSFGYYLNNVKIQQIIYSSNEYDAMRLAELSSNNMLLKLISDSYNPGDLDDPCNIIELYDDDSLVTSTEQIMIVDGERDLPIMNEDLLLVKHFNDDPCDGEVDWSIYHKDAGMLFKFESVSSNPDDPCYFDPCDLSTISYDLTGWRLGWFGKSPPTFSNDSDSFSDVPFIMADPSENRFYKGQGSFAGELYQEQFKNEEVLGVFCMNIQEDGVESLGKTSASLFMAKDDDDTIWLFKALVDGAVIFEADILDQVIPIERYPEIRMRLLAGEDFYEEGTTFTSGQPGEQITQTIVSLEESLEQWPDFDDELIQVKWTSEEDPCHADWVYYHESYGKVLDLWDNALDPCDIDVEGDGWTVYDPCEVTEMYLTIKADKNRDNGIKDKFILEGELEPMPDPCDTDDSDGTDTLPYVIENFVFVRVGPYQAKIAFDDEDAVWLESKQIWIYKGRPHDSNDKLTVKINLAENTFWFYGKNTDLTGISDPVKVEMAWGDYYFSGEPFIKKGEVPSILMNNTYDALNYKKYRYVSDDGPRNNKISIEGGISTKLDNIDMSACDVTIKWGSSTTISLEAGDFRASRDGKRFKYKNGSVLRYAYFDLKKCKYKLRIHKTGLAAPEEDLTITIKDEDGDTLFSQTVTVE